MRTKARHGSTVSRPLAKGSALVSSSRGFAGSALGASRGQPLGASLGQPLFFVFGRAGIHRTETNARSKLCSRTSGGRTRGRDFWPLNADDSRIARSRQEDGERKVPWCSTVNHRANSHPDRNRSTILALTEDVRLCQFATSSWSAAPSRPISGRASVTDVVTTLRADNCGTRASGAMSQVTEIIHSIEAGDPHAAA